MSHPDVPVFKPLIEQEEINAARETLEAGWLGMGRYVGDFEREIERLIGVEDRYVVAVSTGHAALHLALLLAGVGPGDEVITPSFNNAADFQAIAATGAEPVFSDIEDHSLCIDVRQAEQLVSSRTRAMIVMDYGGILCDHERVARMSESFALRIVHDAAHSFGAKHKGRPVGSFSDMTMFSFDPAKTITCIDGGALVVRSTDEVQRLQEMRLIGINLPPKVMYTNERAGTYDLRSVGFRYHMANLHAAIGLAQLAKLQAITESRRAACRYYSRRLSRIPQVRAPQSDFSDVVPFLYYVRVPADARDGLRAFLRECGVETAIHWQPGHSFSLFKTCRRGDLSVTETVGREVLSLPLHSLMSHDTIDRIVDGIDAFFSR